VITRQTKGLDHRIHTVARTSAKKRRLPLARIRSVGSTKTTRTNVEHLRYPYSRRLVQTDDGAWRRYCLRITTAVAEEASGPAALPAVDLWGPSREPGNRSRTAPLYTGSSRFTRAEPTPVNVHLIRIKQSRRFCGRAATSPDAVRRSIP